MAYSAEDEAFIAEQEAYLEAQLKQNTPQTYTATAALFGNKKQNLVEWQLDFSPELREIERVLRADILTIDPKRGEVWVRNPDPERVPLNDLGVSDVTREIRAFLNKNLVLSYYRHEELSPRLKMFGHELRALIYNNAEIYGIDNEYKQNNYAIIVVTILQMIESAYRRAINGEERKGLGEARIVNQTDPIMPMGGMGGYGNYANSKRTKWYNPFTWGR